ncbi:MAG: serine/threonine-protein kinase [Planctomycetaceae bacterium]
MSDSSSQDNSKSDNRTSDDGGASSSQKRSSARKSDLTRTEQMRVVDPGDEPPAARQVESEVYGIPQPADQAETLLEAGVGPVPVPTVRQLLARNFVTGTGMARAVDFSDCLLGEFRLLRRIGAGGMAQVYLAEQTSLKRNVAIKVMKPDMGGDDTYRRRFEQEATTAAGLNHQNIVQVYAVGEADGLQFIAQEYVLGLNLVQYIRKRKPPSAHLAIHLMKQVCGALHAAHSSGIVHRDIKPENIMVTRKMVAKVTDFGLAQLTHGGERVNLTQMGVTMGTPLYMSPEQINDASVDHRADLYSLGVTFFHVLVGEPPFSAMTAVALAYKHLNEAPPALSSRRPDLPASLIGLIHRLMAKDPAERFESARAVQSELKRIEKSGELSQSWSAAQEEEEMPESRTWWSVPRPVLKKFAIACLIVFFLAMLAGRSRRTENRQRTRAKEVSARHQADWTQSSLQRAGDAGRSQDSLPAME